MDGNAIPRGAKAAQAALEHVGVKGMKWGVRRQRTSSGAYKVISEDAASARAVLAKPASAHSNAAIQEALNRMRLETQFRELQATMVKPSRTTRAKAFVGSLIGQVGTEQINRVAKGAASIAVENALQGKKVSNKDFAKEVGKRIIPKKK